MSCSSVSLNLSFFSIFQVSLLGFNILLDFICFPFVFLSNQTVLGSVFFLVILCINKSSGCLSFL